MKTINLDAPTAKEVIESMQEGAIFRCNKTVGGMEKVFYGYVSADTGVFCMTAQEGGHYIDQSDAEYFIDFALGNIAEEHEREPTREELDDEAEYQRTRHYGPCLPFGGGA